tara:strand:+ start:363 stop:1355 length:993 start_codon:yes stop_codon:yes gene_type:complete
MEKLIKKILRENKQLLKESCTCYTANPVGGGPMLVYDLCQQGTQAASCSCCCQAWLHPTYVDQQECLTTSVAPPSSGGDDELGLYSNDFLTVDDSDTGGGGTGFIERDNKRANILVPKGGGKSSMKDRLMNEGPICGDKGGKPCGNCGDGYTWTDSYVTNSCICNHTGGAVCQSTGSGMYGNDEDPIEMAFDFNGLKNKGRGDKATDSLRHSNKRNNMKKLKLTETELIETIENIINEPRDMYESRLESFIKKTLRETTKELNEAPNCYYRRRNYANSGYTCVARKCGFSGSNKAFYPGEFGSMDDCNALVIPTGTPKGVNTALNTRNFS